ncbi:MAG: acyl-CoA thioesterase [Bradymonadaceae bacterium]
MSDIDAKLRDFPVVITRPASWCPEPTGDGEILDPDYFAYMEDVRLAYFQALDLFDSRGQWGDLAPVSGPVSCESDAGLHVSDTIQMGARVIDISDGGLQMEYLLVRASDGTVLARGGAEITAYDLGREESVDIPDVWRAAVERLRAE